MLFEVPYLSPQAGIFILWATMICRAAIEYEKKGYAENYEQGQVMEKNLISIAREVEKLRAEVANAEKRARAATAAAAGNQGQFLLNLIYDLSESLKYQHVSSLLLLS